MRRRILTVKNTDGGGGGCAGTKKLIIISRHRLRRQPSCFGRVYIIYVYCTYINIYIYIFTATYLYMIYYLARPPQGEGEVKQCSHKLFSNRFVTNLPPSQPPAPPQPPLFLPPKENSVDREMKSCSILPALSFIIRICVVRVEVVSTSNNEGGGGENGKMCTLYILNIAKQYKYII